nr:MAG: ParB-like nuclease domain [Bacteriophage sp.]
MEIKMRRLLELVPYAANAKKHDARQVANVAESIRQFGFVQPVVVDRDGVIVIGHCRALAAEKLGMVEVPCVCVDDLTPEQVSALRLVDNKTNESPWDLDLLAAELPELDLSAFDFEWGELPGAGFDIGSPAACAAAVSENPLSDEDPDYQSFVEKFMPMKTTDDCYTPENVYAVVKDWAVDHYGLSDAEVLRPFYPGGDYKAVTYDEDCVVIDNPPFSIISEICDWYTKNGVRFFLFAPALTLFSIGRGQLNYIGCGASVTFDNGANISISFVTNMGDFAVESAPDLRGLLEAANDENSRAVRKSLPVYSYPANVLTCTMVQYFSSHGAEFRVPRAHLSFVRSLDSQREKGKCLFGSGFLISEKAAAEKAAAEKVAAEEWQLSDREKAIVASLG